MLLVGASSVLNCYIKLRKRPITEIRPSLQ